LKFQLLPSSFESDGSPSARQHLACLVINDLVAVDAGSLAMAATDEMRRGLRDVVLTHAHLDHVAGLPLFIDDLFATLREPITVHALQEVVNILERDIFNWSVFPRFSELDAGHGPPIAYSVIDPNSDFQIADLTFRPFAADHNVPSAGYIISDADGSVAISGDSASLTALVEAVAGRNDVRAILVECAFPNELATIAKNSHHMTPSVLADQLSGLEVDCPVLVINIKPNYREKVIDELGVLDIARLEVMQVGKNYFW
jgi:cAMP phosphodiesterase